MSKKYYWLIGVVIVLAALVWFFKSRTKPAAQTAQQNTAQSQEVAANQSSTTTQSTNSANPPAVDKTYGQLVNQYQGKRIQFGQYCQATPNNVVFKNGTTIMLDNRNNMSEVIKLNSVSYTLSAYGYKLVTLSYKTLPTKVLVDCGSSQNVATITVEK